MFLKRCEQHAGSRLTETKEVSVSQYQAGLNSIVCGNAGSPASIARTPPFANAALSASGFKLTEKKEGSF